MPNTADNNVDLNTDADNNASEVNIDDFFSRLEKTVNGAVYDDETEDNNSEESGGNESKDTDTEGTDGSEPTEKELETLKKRYEASSKEGKRLARELEKYKQYDDMLPILSVIQEDPTLLRQIRSYLKDGSTPQSVVKDLNLGEDFVFDPDEALKDPQSDSAKALNTMIEAGVSRRMAISNQQREAETQKKNAQLEPFLEFQERHDLSDEDINDLIDWAKTETLTPEHLWFLKNRDKRDQTILKGSLEDRQKQLEKMKNTPRSLGKTNASGKQEVDPEKQVFEAILAASGTNLLGD